jgi:signal transduction histidine kinase/CheY-like chemotaxis protein
MNTQRLFAIAIESEPDIIVARQRTRLVAELLGFDAQDQNRVTTAVSEIVRNALEYAGKGRIEYTVREGQPQSLEITVTDKGKGIADLDAVLTGRHISTTGMGVGITGARRLMDDFHIISARGQGTSVVMSKRLSRRAPPVTAAIMNKIAEQLSKRQMADPIAEIRRQNQETLLQFNELQKRQEELEQLNQELSDTNRGVVALYAELEERADHLRRADQLKTRFLSNMSHEFRTPLNSILSLSRLLLSRVDGALSPEQERQVQFIRTGAETLTELVNNLLDLARVEAGKTVVTSKDFTVDDLFGALRGMLRPILVTDKVELVFEPDEPALSLRTDEAKVSQILRNFISNAIKFTEQGEIRVWAEHNRDDDTVTFHVRDTGLGVAPQDLGKIWEEFGQVENARQSRFKGTGLGLPLAKKFAVLLGGDASVVSEPGHGSTFSVTIPRVYDRSGAEPLAQWTLDSARIPVLVLEDNAADSFNIERILEHSRYQPLVARTVAEAKNALSQVTPAAMIFDVLLEGDESWRLLIEIKQNERTHHVPVVVVSSSEEERKARNFGADEYLAKPFDAGVLVRTLDELTGSASATRVLLVDDEEVSRYLIRQLLPHGPFVLTEAASAEQALIVAQQSKPDLILLDLDMPGTDGFAFLQQLAEHPDLKTVPVVVATAMVITDAHRARLSRAASIISKFDLSTPVLVNALRAAHETKPEAVPA